MSASTFDTLKFVKQLEASVIPPVQARLRLRIETGASSTLRAAAAPAPLGFAPTPSA